MRLFTTPAPSNQVSIATTVAREHWSAHDLIEWPAHLHPAPDQLYVNSKMLAPLRDSAYFTLKSNQSIRNTILGLLFSSSPSNVGWLVMAVIIYALQSMAHRRAWADISQELLKRIGPFGANENTAPTIAIIILGVRIKAAGFHRLPARIFWRAALACMAVFGDALKMQAAAAAALPGAQIDSARNGCAAAVALTKPSCLFSNIRSSRNYEQSVVSISSQVIKSWHMRQIVA